MDPLDNPIYAGLIGGHADLGRRLGKAAAYAPEVAPFVGVADPGDPACWSDLVEMMGSGGRAALFLAEAPRLPATVVALRQRNIVQMVGPEVASPQPDRFTGLLRLSTADSGDMLDLAKRNEPGPMQSNTVSMGAYWGVRDDARTLIAMAGERMAPPGYVEISAVCTDIEHRGHGLASRLVSRLVSDALARGIRSFLHVKTENTSVQRLYERLGFAVRREMHLSVILVR